MSRSSRWNALRDDGRGGGAPRPPGSGGGTSCNNINRRRPRGGGGVSSPSLSSLRSGNTNARGAAGANNRRKHTGTSIGNDGSTRQQQAWVAPSRVGARIITGGANHRSSIQGSCLCSTAERELQSFDQNLSSIRRHLLRPCDGDGENLEAHTLQQQIADIYSSPLVDGSNSEQLGTDPKRLGETIRVMFQCIECVAARCDLVEFRQMEQSVYDATTRIFVSQCHAYCDKEKAGMFSFSTANIDSCIISLVNRIRSVMLLDTNATATGASTSVGPTSMLCCLGAILAQFGFMLAAEETAERVVRPLLLPILELAASCDSVGTAIDATTSPNNDTDSRRDTCRANVHETLKCIAGLLQHKQQSSAILAPLVFDITNDGEERQVDNPLRLRLLASLQALILCENEDQILVNACNCLSIALDAIYAIDHGNKARGKGCGKEATDINIASVSRKIRILLERSSALREDTRTLRWYTLQLLTSLARAYPKASSSQWALFLEETLLTYDPLWSQPSSPSSSSPPMSQLVAFIRNDCSGSVQISEQERVAAIGATKAVLSTMPLKLWYGMDSRRAAHRTFTGSGSLASRVSKALKSLLETVRDVMKASGEISDELVVEICCLVEAMIRTEPFDVDETLALALTDVLAELGKLLGDITRGKRPVRDIGVSIAGVSVAKVLEKGVGGTITPKGSLLQLSKPATYWLGRDESRDFLAQMLVLVNDDSATIDASLKDEICNLMLLILRMAPWISSGKVWTEDHIAAIVRSFLDDSDSRRRLLGLRFVRQYIQGRNDFSTERSSFVCEAFCPLMLRTLADTNAAVRTSSAAAYGLLLVSDWLLLLGSSSCPAENNHFRLLLRLCINRESSKAQIVGEKAAGVRSEACKAIGNFCTECIIMKEAKAGEVHSKSGMDIVVRDVVDAMLVAVKDKNAGVRGMALFAVGNLALSLQSIDSSPDMSGSQLLVLCESVRECLTDKNDKVVGNAIRSVGHLLNLIRQSGDRSRVQSEALYRDTVKILTQKLDLALDIATGLSTTHLSWKQRSYAKKHSWGACHTLGVLLQSSSSEDAATRELFLPGLSQMIRCVQLAYELSEKVAAAAAASLRSTPIDMWRNCSGESTVVADGLTACLVVVYNETIGVKKLSPQILEDVRILLQTFLTVSSTTDAVSSFSREDISPGMLDFLYSWMVDKGSKSSSFDAIAIALNSNDRSEIDVSIEQRFSSRARHERRSRGKTTLSPVSQVVQGADFEDEDEDEL